MCTSISLPRYEGLIDKLVKSFVFMPPKMSDQDKLNYESLPNLAFVTTQSGNKIYYVVSKASIPTNKYLIFSHGNSCDNYHMYQCILYFSNKFNINVVSYDYPSYGLSTGHLNEESCYEAHETVVEVFKSMVGEENIYLIGQSIGTGIVVDYISKHPMFTTTILLSPYTSVANVAIHISDYLRFGFLIPKWLIPYATNNFAFDSISKADKIKSKVLIVHGSLDNIIPVNMGKELCNSIGVQFTIEPIILDHCGHNDMMPFDIDTIDRIKPVFA